MKVLVKNYADFKATVGAIGDPSGEIYYDNGAGQFKITAFVAAGNIAVCLSSTQDAPSVPPEFPTDFPTAVRLTADYSIA